MHIIRTALCSGLIVGVIIACLHMLATTPLILEAEKFEQTTWFGGHQYAATLYHGDHTNTGQFMRVHGGSDHDDNVIMRYVLSVITAVITYFALALILGACMMVRFAQSPDDAKHKHYGILWGLAGGLSFVILPGLGLPPELPGAGAPDLLDRQIWWFATIIASIIGLWLMFFYSQRHIGFAVLSCVIIAAPHIIGAPHVSEFQSRVAAEISALFAARSLGISIIGWLLLGYINFNLLIKYKPS